MQHQPSPYAARLLHRQLPAAVVDAADVLQLIGEPSRPAPAPWFLPVLVGLTLADPAVRNRLAILGIDYPDIEAAAARMPANLAPDEAAAIPLAAKST